MKFFLSLFFLWVSLSANPFMECGAGLTLEVGDRDVAARAAIASAEARGGWLLEWDEEHVVVRVPAVFLDSFLVGLDQLGQRVEQQYSSQDRSVDVDDLTASIASRRKLLDSYFSMVQSSVSSQIQTVERAIVDLIRQIELDEGRLQAMQSRIQMSRVEIHFQFQDRSLPAPTGVSPFPWLNHLNLVKHREEF
ncbi:MAG TPA: DUF4349 domain-containing protein [Fibrobacteraceae bacterium]|nr:DUF4349 domain-containing protein [Fibrobacteraceae bacterium]